MRVRGPARGHPGFPRPVSRAGCAVRRGELGAGVRPPGRRDQKPDRRRLADHHRSSRTDGCRAGAERPGLDGGVRARSRRWFNAGVPDDLGLQRGLRRIGASEHQSWDRLDWGQARESTHLRRWNGGFRPADDGRGLRRRSLRARRCCRRRRRCRRSPTGDGSSSCRR